MEVSINTITEVADPSVAPSNASRMAHNTRHIPQGCMLSGSRDGFFGNAIERHHRAEKGRKVLKWL